MSMSGSVVTARAAVLRSPGQPLSLEEVAVPSPGRGEVRVRMLATGVCRSDVSMAAGKIPLGRTDPFVLGHEGYGVVEDIGPEVSSLSPGAHVVLAAVPNCGHCWHCLHAEGALCDERAQHFPSRAQDKDGAPVWGLAGIGTFAEVTCVSASSVTEVRSTLPAAELALLGCAMLTGVGAVTKSAGVRHANAVVIVGCGGVGQVALQAARMVGAAPLIAIEPNSAKRELALSSGATHTLDPMAEDVIARVREITEGRGADHVIDFVATSATLGTSWTMTRRGGQLTVVGMPDPTSALPVNVVDLVSSCRRLTGSYFGATNPHTDLPELVRLIEHGHLNTSVLVSRRRSLEEVNDAIADLQDSTQIVRSVITFE